MMIVGHRRFEKRVRSTDCETERVLYCGDNEALYCALAMIVMCHGKAHVFGTVC